VSVALLLAFASPVLAQQAEALQPRVSPATITVGALLTYTVEVPVAAGERIAGPGAEADFRPWEVRGYNVQPGSGTVTVIYALTAFQTGGLGIPSLEIAISDAAGRARTVRTAPVEVTVASVLQGGDTKPADIVGPLSLREKPLAVALRVLLLGVLIVAIVLAAWALWRRRRRRIVEAQSRPDPPEVVALKALQALRAARLPEAGRIKHHFSDLSDILRAYLAARYGLRTLEETTARIVAQMRRAGETREYAPVVEDLLRQADLAKFAKARPELVACWGAVDAAERLVKETAPIATEAT